MDFSSTHIEPIFCDGQILISGWSHDESRLQRPLDAKCLMSSIVGTDNSSLRENLIYLRGNTLVPMTPWPFIS